MEDLHIKLNSRFLLRDFHEADRAAFIAYQTDPRYRSLYNLDDDETRAHQLFDLFNKWTKESPRLNFQLGIFEQDTGHLCGCAGLRSAEAPPGQAELGIELAPVQWGRYRLALDTAGALIEYGFSELGFNTVFGVTASGNTRVEKLSKWFGATIIESRAGPKWMGERGWKEVVWKLDRDAWENAKRPDFKKTLE